MYKAELTCGREEPPVAGGGKAQAPVAGDGQLRLRLDHHGQGPVDRLAFDMPAREARELEEVMGVGSLGHLAETQIEPLRKEDVQESDPILRETVGRVRYGGAKGQLTVRADSGFYAHAILAVFRETNVRFSITNRQHARLRNIIEAIPEADWTPIPYWTDGAADVAETTYRACLRSRTPSRPPIY